MQLWLGDEIRCQIAGESSLIYYFKSDSLRAKNKHASTFFRLLVDAKKDMKAPWITELVPSFDSVLVEYEFLQVDHHFVISAINHLCAKHQQSHQVSIAHHSSTQTALHTGQSFSQHTANTHCFPIWYDHDEEESDFNDVCKQTGLSKSELVNMHSQIEYRVFAVGFQPGFAYLGQIDAKLILPRKDKPRLRVPKGALAIAEEQTAIYPNASPGGWHILGLCPIDLPTYQAGDMPMLIGDSVKFEAIKKQEFLHISKAESKGLA